MEYLILGSDDGWQKEVLPGQATKAAVGTIQELDIAEYPGPYQWDVSVTGGSKHPLWGKNCGSASDLKEAKRKAEEFISKERKNAPSPGIWKKR